MFASQTPTSRPNHLRWQYTKIERGTAVKGWLAGPVCGVHVHFTHEGSKPCRQHLTDGALACRFCVAGIRMSWLGYVPMYDTTLKQVVTGIKESNCEYTLNLPLHTTITARRGSGYRDPVMIREERNSQRMPISDQRSTAADLRPWLLVLWSDPEITSHFAAHAPLVASAAAEQLTAAVPAAVIPAQVAPMMAIASAPAALDTDQRLKARQALATYLVRGKMKEQSLEEKQVAVILDCLQGRKKGQRKPKSKPE